MLRLVHDRKLPGIPPGAGSFCEAGAVSRAHVAAVDRGKVGENYLLGGADATYVEMVRVVGEVLGEPVIAKPLPLWMIEALGRVSQWGSYVTRRAPLVTPETAIALGHPYAVKCDKAIRDLGYEVTPLREMLEIAHTWMVEQHILPKRSATPGAAAKVPTAPANKGEIELVVTLDRPLAPEAAHALKAAVSKRAAAATCPAHPRALLHLGTTIDDGKTAVAAMACCSVGAAHVREGVVAVARELGYGAT